MLILLGCLCYAGGVLYAIVTLLCIVVIWRKDSQFVDRILAFGMACGVSAFSHFLFDVGKILLEE